MKIFPMATLKGAELIPARFTTERDQLHAALQYLAKVTERRNTLPILANVLVAFDGCDTVTLIATDLDVQAAIELRVASIGLAVGFSITVDCHTFADAVKKSDKGAMIECTVDEYGKLLIAAGRTRSKLDTLPREGFPVIAAGTPSHSFTLDAAALKADVAALSHAMSKEEHRFYLRGIAMQERDDRLMFVATDGHRLAATARPLPDEASGIPDSIIPAKMVGLIERALKKADGSVAVSLSPRRKGPDRITLTIGALTLTSKLIDGTFPDWQKVIPANIGQVEAEDIAMPEFYPRLDPKYVTDMTKGIGEALVWEAGADAARVTCPDRPEFFGMIMYRGTSGEAPAADSAGSATWTDEHGNETTIALGCKIDPNGGLGLSAEAVAAMCGPVDPSTFVAIPRLTFLHGRIIARDGIATDGTGRRVVMATDLKPLSPAKQRSRDHMLTHDHEAMAAYVAMHEPAYFDPPAAVAPLMITYQPSEEIGQLAKPANDVGAPVEPASDSDPETAVARQPAPAPISAPDVAQPMVATEGQGSVLERLAAIERAIGLETGTNGNAALESTPTNFISPERRLRMIRAYLAVRKSRAGLREVLRAEVETRLELHETFQSSRKEWLERNSELLGRAMKAEAALTEAEQRERKANVRLLEANTRLGTIAQAIADAPSAPTADDDAIRDNVRAVEAEIAGDEAALDVAEDALGATAARHGFKITRRDAA